MTNEQSVREQNDESFEELVDALDHIARVCRGSRTSTRRLRWIESRATCALTGDRDWRDINHPKMEPRIQAAEDLIVSVFDVFSQWVNDMRIGYRPEDIEENDEVREAIETVEAFLKEARRLPTYRRRERERAKFVCPEDLDAAGKLEVPDDGD